MHVLQQQTNIQVSMKSLRAKRDISIFGTFVFHHQSKVVNICVTFKYLNNIKSKRLVTQFEILFPIFVYGKSHKIGYLL